MTYRDNDQFRGGQMSWGNQPQPEANRFGYQDFRGQERFSEPPSGRYSQGGYGQGEHWPSHRGDWGQGRMEGRRFGGEDQYGDYSGRFSGGYGNQEYGRGQQYGGQGGPGSFQQSRGQGFDQQGYRSQGQMSGQGDWNQRFGSEGGYGNQSGSGWGSQGQGQMQQGYSAQSYGQGQRDWGSSQQGWSNQDYGNWGNYGGGQGGMGDNGTFTYTEVWLIPGPHAGRGPRGYQRSSQRIEEDVCERLSQHGLLDASDIQVKIADGEVTLTGTVGSRQEKRMAEDALDSISGIKDVHNQLRVQHEQTPQQGGQASRTQESRGQSRSGKENANSNREKELATTSSG
jgi:osmotically-inducible protein OsmY